ncbi:MAG: enoyl-CoA hydratase/isomerase family protein [Proteobacteria bacterium]|nr:enoyl-CoA hydratase/isomerase family protein [Pseudomonadota bacterium]MBU1386431.1 enoyl-CoA hydratase/isomerase family protein [Pseudomonadota bacterium]MBU1544542.1 enoyl-CoA hydratase/isomerase family protein [Pseudomonadota bacterium]MBU2431440.1 enoyl-CoA hydratase/isomerase family protein [Pseudomonadota bacterium]MBU2480992.1 enoyl-CoA hydratase/isomerase family protein [Pseudomonadota bacterium]
MKIIEWEKKETVAVMTMCNTANRMHLEFVNQMHQCLEQILADEDVFSLIITSKDDKNFSQGIDLEWIMKKHQEKDFDSIKSFLFGMNDIFKKLLLMPIPVIAAINGHAFGDGAMLACSCDFRFMKQDKGFFCFPEVDINIPFLPGMIKFVRKAIPEYQFNQMILSGKRCGAKELYDAHVLVKACVDNTELQADALAFAKTFKKPRGIFGELKKRMHKNIVQVMDTEDIKEIEISTLLS